MWRELLACLFCVAWLVGGVSWAEESVDQAADESLQVIKPFVEQEVDREMFTEEEKHQILFAMGAVLLLLLIATITFGVGMVLFDKPWFVGHMVSAGLTVTLAVAHAVAAVVWFFPF